MPRLRLKLPKKLTRVEIIRGKELKTEDYFAYLPLDKMPLEEYFQEIYETEVAELRDKETELEIFQENNIPIYQKFYHEINFSEQTAPVPISLDKLPEEVVPIEEVKRQVQEAYEKGFKDGQEVTRDFFTDEMMRHQEWVRRFDTITEKLRHQYSKELVKLEDMIISLGMISAEHILQSEVTYNSQIVVQQVKKAIAEVDNESIFRILVHPESYEVLNQVKSKLLSSPAESMKIQIQSDDSIDKGGCLLETSSGIIDGKLRTQLATIKQRLDSVPPTQILDSSPEEFGFDPDEFL